MHTWGLVLMVGFLLATYFAASRARRFSIAPEDVWDIAFVGLFGGIVGARLAWVAQNIPHILAHPAEIFAIWTGGMTSFGGFFGGILAGWLMCRYKKIRFADMADLAGIAFPIGYGIGRIGCFLNGCCYGGECSLPWAVPFHWEDGKVHMSHPAQLYSVIASVILFAVLLPIFNKRKFPGQVMLSFLIAYGLYRFLIEFVRVGATADLSGLGTLTLGQIVSLIQSVGATIFYLILSRRAVRS